MNKFIRNNSYTITLLFICAITMVIFIAKAEPKEQYLKVVVEKGDTLWAYSQTYSEYRDIDTEKFIDWIEQENGIVNGNIKPGDVLILPINKDEVPTLRAEQ